MIKFAIGMMAVAVVSMALIFTCLYKYYDNDD